MTHQWVCEDDPTNRVRVRKAICSRCNDGRGLKGSHHLDNRWRGPFETEREAIECALNTGHTDARGCWFCLREIGILLQLQAEGRN